MRVLTNFYQAENLTKIFAECRPEKRLAVAAVILDISVADILTATGMTPRVAAYHMARESNRRSTPYLRSDVMRDIARVLGVPLTALWDDEALDNPMGVLQTTVRVYPGLVKFSEARSQKMKERHQKKRDRGKEDEKDSFGSTHNGSISDSVDDSVCGGKDREHDYRLRA